MLPYASRLMLPARLKRPYLNGLHKNVKEVSCASVPDSLCVYWGKKAQHTIDCVITIKLLHTECIIC